MTKKEEASTGEDWKTMALTLVTNVVQTAAKNAGQQIHERIDHAVNVAVKKIIMGFLGLVAMSFLLVGFAQLVGTYLGLVAYGYIAMGVLAGIIALFMHVASRD